MANDDYHHSLLSRGYGAEVATTTSTNHSPHVPQKGDEIILGAYSNLWVVQSRRLILSFHDRIEWNVYIA